MLCSLRCAGVRYRGGRTATPVGLPIAKSTVVLHGDRKTVLIVDDEELFRRTVVDGVESSSSELRVLTATNGEEALTILAARRVDIVVTDLKMPVMDGFELLAQMSRHHPAIPAIVMTAFGTADIERRILDDGHHAYLDKPLSLDTLLDKIEQVLEGSAAGRIEGITIPTFLQMIALEKKTCTLHIRAGKSVGEVGMYQGALSHAVCDDLSGEEAAMKIACWRNAAIEIISARAPKPSGEAMSLEAVLLEAFRRHDEAGRPAVDDDLTDLDGEGSFFGLITDRPRSTDHPPPTEQEFEMAVQDKLKELASIDGFGGAAVFTPTGESLASLAGDMRNLNQIGILANNVLLNAQKASLEMGTGRGQQVHIQAENAHMLVRCLNEGTDPLKSQPGKAHIHMVLVLKDDSSIGLAKMKANAVCEKLAEDFRF